MKYLKILIFLVGSLAVIWIILTNPQYAEETAQAVSILAGERKCICEE